MPPESTTSHDESSTKRPNGKAISVQEDVGGFGVEGCVERHSFNDCTSTEPSIVVNAFTLDGFVVLRNAIDRQSLQQIWSPYASRCFQECFRILHQNGHVAAPTDKIVDGSYTMKQGMKHGFAELVMRSPGRYELSLRHLLQELHADSDDNIHSSKLPALPHHPEELLRPIQSLLPQLLGIDTDGNQDLKAQDQNDTSPTSILYSNINLIHLSLLVASPGSSDQAWHADGGHVSLQQHLPCHCFNIFIPLQDTPHSMGPTELRPASHLLTRGDLAKNMLVAKCRKTLQPPVWPALNLGDVLIFDYRILHRGRANNNNNNSTQLGVENNNRNYLVLTYAQPWFQDVLNFPRHPSIYDDLSSKRQEENNDANVGNVEDNDQSAATVD
jgi:Phytanoyl-CoA dioxygenase (PhyH)